jgi:hypothetical protein
VSSRIVWQQDFSHIELQVYTNKIHLLQVPNGQVYNYSPELRPNIDQPAIDQLDVTVLGSLDGVWKDALQWPVEISQILTTPLESLEIAMPSFACRVMDLIGAEARGVDSRSVTAGSPNRSAICQNLTDPSSG